MVCKPNSEVAQKMVRRFIASKGKDNDLHRLGVLLHTYVDTWAHQGFSGMLSDGNSVTHLHHDGDHRDGLLTKLFGHIEETYNNIQSAIVGNVVKVGHGAALTFPDLPWAKWEYINGLNNRIERDNLRNFVAAANMAHKVIDAYIAGDEDFMARPDMPAEDKALIESVLGGCQTHDAEERLENIADLLSDGGIAAVVERIPNYIAKGEGSWKHAATGLTTDGDGDSPPAWTSGFEESDYRRFHDAVKEHRMEITHYLLPSFGIRLA